MDDPVAVVVVTTFDLDENVHAAVCAGARGFLLKNAGPRLLQEAVRAAADGESMVSPTITSRLLAHYAAAHVRRKGPVHDRPSDPLTERETEVVAVMARGLTNAEIASQLMLGLSTVKVHLAAAARKTGARNRTEVAVWAWEYGLVRR